MSTFSSRTIAAAAAALLCLVPTIGSADTISGVVNIFQVNAPKTIHYGSSSRPVWKFFGNYYIISIKEGQKVVGSASVPLKAANHDRKFGFGLCFRLNNGVIQNFMQHHYQIFNVSSNDETLLSSSAALFGRPAGTYAIGPCYLPSTLEQYEFDNVNSWFLVSE